MHHSDEINFARMDLFRKWAGYTRHKRRNWESLLVFRAMYRVKLKSASLSKLIALLRSKRIQRDRIVDKMHFAQSARARKACLVSFVAFRELDLRFKHLESALARRRVVLTLRFMQSLSQRTLDLCVCHSESVIMCRLSRLLQSWNQLFRESKFSYCISLGRCRSVFRSLHSQFHFNRIRFVAIKSILSQWSSITESNQSIMRAQTSRVMRETIHNLRTLAVARRHDRRRILSASMSRYTQRFKANHISLFLKLWAIRMLQSVSSPHRACMRRVVRGWSIICRQSRSFNSRLLTLTERRESRLINILFPLWKVAFENMKSVHFANCQTILSMFSNVTKSQRNLNRRSCVLHNRLKNTQAYRFLHLWNVAMNIRRFDSRTIKRLWSSIVLILRNRVNMKLRKRIALFRANKFMITKLSHKILFAWSRFTQSRKETMGSATLSVAGPRLLRTSWHKWVSVRPVLAHEKEQIELYMSKIVRRVMLRSLHVFAVYSTDQRTERMRLVREYMSVIHRRCRRYLFVWVRIFARVHSIQTVIIQRRLKRFFKTWLHEYKLHRDSETRVTKFLLQSIVKRWIRCHQNVHSFRESVLRGRRLKFFLAWIVGIEKLTSESIRVQKIKRSYRERWMRMSIGQMNNLARITSGCIQNERRKFLHAWNRAVRKIFVHRTLRKAIRIVRLPYIWNRVLVMCETRRQIRVEKIHRIRKVLVLSRWSRPREVKTDDSIESKRNYMCECKKAVKGLPEAVERNSGTLGVAQYSHYTNSGKGHDIVRLDEVVMKLFRIKDKISYMGLGG